MRCSRQRELALHLGTRGGRRRGAGRRPGRRPAVRHLSRPSFAARFPAHVTLKALPGLPSLRSSVVVAEVLHSFRSGCERPGFRLVHFSIQHDHLHALVEADGPAALGRGMKSLAARFARAVNRALERRGPVLRDRYHLHVLRTAREVRNALAYVLYNARRHLARRGLPAGARGWIDPASSAAWLSAWRGTAGPRPSEPPPVATATTWLLRVGWQRDGGLPLEAP